MSFHNSLQASKLSACRSHIWQLLSFQPVWLTASSKLVVLMLQPPRIDLLPSPGRGTWILGPASQTIEFNQILHRFLIDFWSIFGPKMAPKMVQKLIKNQYKKYLIFLIAFWMGFGPFWDPFWLPKLMKNWLKIDVLLKTKDSQIWWPLQHVSMIFAFQNLQISSKNRLQNP